MDTIRNGQMAGSNTAKNNNQSKSLAELLVMIDQLCKTAHCKINEGPIIVREAERRYYAPLKMTKIVGIAILIIYCMFGLPLFESGSWIGTVIGLMVLNAFVAAMVLGMRRYKNQSNEAKQGVEKARQEANRIINEGHAIINDNLGLFNLIPSDYWYPMATEYIAKMVCCGRAYTVNQALAMYDEQLHRWRLEEYNAQITAEQKAQTNALNSIRRSSATSAAANVISAASHIASWF